MSDIFLSYDKEDRQKVQKLANMLEQVGWSVFWDPEIPIGKNWRMVINSEINNAGCVIVVWSKKSVDSHWVLEEAEIGRQRDVLIPVLIENVLPPIGFQTFQAADLSEWDGEIAIPPFMKLVSAIKSILGSPLRMYETSSGLSSVQTEPKDNVLEQTQLLSTEQAQVEDKKSLKWSSPAIYIRSIFRIGFFGPLIGLAFAYFENIGWNTYSPEDAGRLSDYLSQSIGIGLGAVLGLEISELLLNTGLRKKIIAFVAPVIIFILSGVGGQLTKGDGIIGSGQIMMFFGVLGYAFSTFYNNTFNPGYTLRFLRGLVGAILGATIGLLILIMIENWGGHASIEVYFYSFLGGAIPGIILTARKLLP